MKHKLFLRRFFASLLLCAVSTLSFAGFVVDGITYINEDEKSVSVDIGYLPYSGSVTIPSSVTYEDKTYSVTSIGGRAFSGCSGLTSITIPESVTSIGWYAFDGCSGLKSVTIPNSVTSIGDFAFRDCSGLTSITIPENVTSIGSSAFEDCSNLTSVTIGSGVTRIGNNAFENCTGLTKAEFVSIESLCKISFTFLTGHSSNPLYYAKHLYLNGEEVKDLIIPNSVTSIGNYAFYGCSGLTSVTIGNSVTSIGYDAFQGCSGLTSVIIPESVTNIGGKAFYGCSGLTSVIIPESVTNIGGKAFYGCSSLMSVTINSNAVLSKSYVDDGGMLNRFGGQVTEFIIGNNVTSIGNNAFMACSGLTSITIPNSVTSIGFSAFKSCSGLTSITIPESVTSISSRAFENCSGLTSVIIPESVTSIGADAFWLCSGLTKAEFSNIESLCRISFGDNDSNPLYYAKHLYVKGNEVKDVIIPNSVTTIGNFAFYGCSGLTSITIPEGVTSISPRAFTGCSGLTSITIPESVASIGIATFYGCSGLTSVTIGNGVTSIDAEAFRGCSGLTSVTIGSIVTSIGEGAFYDCSSLKSVTCLAPNVPNTGRNLFYNVPKSTATLYVPKASVDAYKAANQWKEFGNIVGIDPTAVEELKSNKTSKANENAPIYDLMGRRLSEKPAKGYYVQGGKIYFVK